MRLIICLSIAMICVMFLASCTKVVEFGKQCTPGNKEYSYVWIKPANETTNVSKDNCNEPR